MAASKLSFLPSFVCSRHLLLGIIVFQWILVTFLISQLTHYQQTQQDPVQGPSIVVAAKEGASSPDSSLIGRLESKNFAIDSLPGVGAIVLFRSPQWFHLRTTQILHNAIVNLPPGWGLQLFINPSWFYGDARVLHWHPGLRRLLTVSNGESQAIKDKNRSSTTTQYRGTFRGRPIFVTWLPESLTKRPAKPKGVLHSRWFWQELQAERVLLFSGNGVFCGNHVLINNDSSSTKDTPPNTIWEAWGWTSQTPSRSDDYLDYMGTPWRQHGGMGGDGGSHSYRNRTSMLRLLNFAKDDQSWKGPAEHVWVLQTMKKYNNEHSDGIFRIASPEQTQTFGGVLNISSGNKALNHIPYVASGTFANLAWDERETLLKHCPEIKTIFPSLHEPSCFGAHPQPDICRKTICALQENVPSSGC